MPAMDSFLATCEGKDRSAVYIRCRNMSVVHISQLVNSLFNEYCERLCANRLRRVQKVAFFPGSDAMVAEECVLHGAPYMALVSFKGVQGTRTSAAIFSFSKCLVDNKIVPNPSVQGLRDTPNAIVRGPFMSFKKKDGISNLVWTSRFWAPVDVHSRGMCFVNLNVNEQGQAGDVPCCACRTIRGYGAKQYKADCTSTLLQVL